MKNEIEKKEFRWKNRKLHIQHGTQGFKILVSNKNFDEDITFFSQHRVNISKL